MILIKMAMQPKRNKNKKEKARKWEEAKNDEKEEEDL